VSEHVLCEARKREYDRRFFLQGVARMTGALNKYHIPRKRKPNAKMRRYMKYYSHNLRPVIIMSIIHISIRADAQKIIHHIPRTPSSSSCSSQFSGVPASDSSLFLPLPFPLSSFGACRAALTTVLAAFHKGAKACWPVQDHSFLAQVTSTNDVSPGPRSFFFNIFRACVETSLAPGGLEEKQPQPMLRTSQSLQDADQGKIDMGLLSQTPAALHQNSTHNHRFVYGSTTSHHFLYALHTSPPSSVRLFLTTSTTIVLSEERGIITHPNFTILEHHHIIPSPRSLTPTVVFVLT
jgi:hypothetical protein